MVVDTSVLIAILLQEPEAARLSRALALDLVLLVSAATLVEAGILIHLGLTQLAVDRLDLGHERTEM